MSYKYFSNIQRCNCPKKFQGEHCEIGMGILTLTGEEGAPETWGQGGWARCKSRQESGAGGGAGNIFIPV